MTTAKLKEIKIPVAPHLQEKWDKLKLALNDAAAPYIAGDRFPIGPLYAYDLSGSGKEVEAVMRAQKEKVGVDIHHSFAVQDGKLVHVLSHVS